MSSTTTRWRRRRRCAGKLQDRGIKATQATISRDLKELGLVKRAGDGAYVAAWRRADARAPTDQLEARA